MDLVSQAVTHKAFGEGVIVSQDAKHVSVEFGGGEVKQFAYPGVFSQFMTLNDGELQAAVEKEVSAGAPARPDARREVLRRLEERARLAAQPAPQAPQAPAAKKAASRPASKTPTTKATSKARAPRADSRTTQVITGSVAVTRAAGKPVAFLAYQGPLLESQANGGYLWAPLKGADGQKVPSWDRLEELRPGDVVLHEAGGLVHAVSRVMALWFKTSDLDGARHYGRPGCMGRHVDCSYVPLANPVQVEGLREEIVGDDDSADGFLYKLDAELSQVILGEAVELNPALGRQAFVRRFLEG